MTIESAVVKIIQYLEDVVGFSDIIYTMNDKDLKNFMEELIEIIKKETQGDE